MGYPHVSTFCEDCEEDDQLMTQWVTHPPWLNLPSQMVESEAHPFPSSYKHTLNETIGM